MNKNAPFILAISGGSGSGKTTFARKVKNQLGDENVAILGQDSYYIDQSHHFDKDGGKVNFDHPSALDFPLMAEHIKALKSGRAVEVPIYDFATHKRLKETQTLKPKPYILVDGILIFHPEDLVTLFDYKVFIDTPENLRLERRLKRDVEERGRTPEGVRIQFMNQVKPMHDQFVEPSKKLADLKVAVNEFDQSVINVINTISEL